MDANVPPIDCRPGDFPKWSRVLCPISCAEPQVAMHAPRAVRVRVHVGRHRQEEVVLEPAPVLRRDRGHDPLEHLLARGRDLRLVEEPALARDEDLGQVALPDERVLRLVVVPDGRVVGAAGHRVALADGQEKQKKGGAGGHRGPEHIW